MANYSNLQNLIPGKNVDTEKEAAWRQVISFLVDAWLDDYRWTRADIVAVRMSGFSYLFDIDAERLVAAWGISHGKHDGKRDKARMAGHPKGAGALYHRGHAIPHTLGGPTDINLMPQLGKVNVGAFRELEKKAVATPGSLYFTHWRYPPLAKFPPKEPPNEPSKDPSKDPSKKPLSEQLASHIKDPSKDLSKKPTHASLSQQLASQFKDPSKKPPQASLGELLASQLKEPAKNPLAGLDPSKGQSKEPSKDPAKPRHLIAQLPIGVEQGLLIPGQPPLIRPHIN